ncbi:MAG: phosphoglycerate kinase, partial [Clostridia bacterium]|nr:phosphoglycerate kinase [Clostridia bacterium]
MSMLNKKTIEDIEVNGLKVIARVDFNVPIDENGRITDDKRIRGALPTIRYLIKNKAKTILVSHLGRPKEGFEPEFSLKPVADRLSKLLGQDVIMANDVVGEDAFSKAKALKEGEVMLLENVRYHK